MMKDVKTLGDEEEEEVEDSTLDVMETQDEDVQGKEKKEDVVKLIETVFFFRRCTPFISKIFRNKLPRDRRRAFQG